MLLDIKNLKFSYHSNGRGVEIVRGVDIGIHKGECVALIGESGCGKTTVGLCVTRLILPERGFISAGQIMFDGKDITKLSHEELRKIRGKKISYVFQEPFSSLNPVFGIYEQIEEALPEKKYADERIAGLLESVGLEKIVGKKKIYPHELSGGMQQRAMIAMALASRPELLILDEPTTALDVTIQRQILDLIRNLKNKLNLSMLFISHDLRIVFDMADRILLMYAGKIAEECSKDKFISSPSHPYSMGLIDSIPSFEHRKTLFNAIEGKAPLFTDLPEGCKFYPRCRFRIDKCQEKEPELEEISEGHFSRCIRTKELKTYGAIKSK